MNRPVVCVGALVKNPEGKHLIVQTTKWQGLWGVPGGKIEGNETMVAAVVREFQEEVGLRLEHVRFAQVQEVIQSPEFCQPAHMVLLDFFADTRDLEPVYNEEILQHRWVTLQEAQTFPLNSFTQTLVQLALQASERLL